MYFCRLSFILFGFPIKFLRKSNKNHSHRVDASHVLGTSCLGEQHNYSLKMRKLSTEFWRDLPRVTSQTCAGRQIVWSQSLGSPSGVNINLIESRCAIHSRDRTRVNALSDHV